MRTAMRKMKKANESVVPPHAIPWKERSIESHVDFEMLELHTTKVCESTLAVRGVGVDIFREVI